MKDIVIYSRYAIEHADPPDVPHLIVSINCPGEPPAKIRTHRGTLGRVDLFFWDLDHRPGGVIIEPTGVELDAAAIPDEHFCQSSDAKKVIDLIEAHPSAERINVHCTAGISRSSATAAALHKILNGSDAVIFDNPRYRPNMRVYRMMLDEWYARHPEK